MIGSRLKFGNVDLSKKTIIEQATYEKLSIVHNTFSRTLRPDVYRNSKRNVKQINIEARYISDTTDMRKVEKELEKIIAELKYEELKELNINEKYCKAVLSEADYSVLGHTALLNLTFINYDGLFYSKVKNVKLTDKLVNEGVDDTEYVVFEITPNKKNVTLTHITSGNKIILPDVSVGNKVFIDLETKTVKQNSRHVKMDSLSDFFVVKKGTNEFKIEGGNVEVKIREVLAL
ncbi:MULTISPECIES: phage distal tail protein [Helcococcus]|uniref:Siphovirus-type tail component C-terminal domain-containing protein n=1 Tax=Helcococcus bovis TaxID=3153252 RepID=A0ABW9F7N2_9FIRM